MFVLQIEFFEELLSRAKSRELELDIPIGPQSREQHEITGEIDDPDRLAHVQHENLSAVSDEKACSTSCVASGMVMKYRRISGWVWSPGRLRQSAL